MPSLDPEARRQRNGRPWRRLRQQILERDGHICHYCGHPGANEADHLTPVKHGGTNHPSNLAAAHKVCNARRGARPLTTTPTIPNLW